jgi:hypothetical protein
MLVKIKNLLIVAVAVGAAQIINKYLGLDRLIPI